MSDKGKSVNLALPTSSDVEQQVNAGFRKADLSKHIKYRAFRVRYPVAEEDGTYRFSFNSISGSGNKSITRPCTREVYSRVYGRHPQNDINFIPVGGLSMQADRSYYIYENRETGIVEAITVGPMNYYNTRSNAPEVLQERTTLELVYHGEGSFEVMFNKNSSAGTMIPQMPGDLKLGEFEQIVNASAAAPQIVPGQQLTKQFRVQSVAGNRVTLSR